MSLTQEKRFWLEFEGNTAWRVCFVTTDVSGTIGIALHWNDKVEPTHYLEVSKKDFYDMCAELIKDRRSGL